MILIADNSKRKIRLEIKEKLYSHDIPCAISNIDNLDMHLPAKLIVVMEHYLYDDVVYLADMHEPSEIIEYDEKPDFADRLIAEFEERYHKKCRNVFSSLYYQNGVFACFFGPYHFTHTEKRILKMLLLADEDCWVTWETISLYCLKGAKPDPKSVAVHVCNINKKVRERTGEEIILHRRYSGYMLK